MKRNMRGIIGILMSASMAMSPVMQAAASNQYNVQSEDVAGSVLFPGDSVAGIEPVYLGPEGTAQELSEGSWTNHSSQAYEMSGMEGEEGGLWLQPVGYVLTVNGGTSRLTNTDGSDTSNHYQAKNDEEDKKKDVAYYEAWADVTVQAADPEEGKIFDHWQIDSGSVALTDAAAAVTNFAMTEEAVVLTAVYADAPVQEETASSEVVQTEPLEEEIAGLEENGEDQEPAGDGTGEDQASGDTGSGEGQDVVIDFGEASGSTDEGSEEENQDTGLEIVGEEENQDTGLEIIGEEENQDTGLEIIGEEENQDAGLEIIGEEENQDTGLEIIGEEENQDAGIEITGDENAVTLDESQSAAAQTYTLTVENGTGSGEYEVGTEVEITAPQLEGMVFTGWTASSDSVWLADSTSPETSFPMPAEAVTVTANFEANLPELYTVQVENGEGGGTYEAGSLVAIAAHEAPEGMEFAGWNVSENVELEDAASMETQFTMPAQDVVLSVVYVPAEEIEEEEMQEETEASEEEILDPEVIETEGETEYAETEMTESQETEMTESEETEAASYRLDLSDENDITVAGASAEDRNDGYGVRLYAQEGTLLTITAAEYDSRIFQGWNVTRADGSGESVETEDDPDNYLSATFIMPDSAVYIEAVYEELNDNEVQVINGSGSGVYTEGDVVEIAANDPQDGYRFKNWIVITGDVVLDDPNSEITEFVMPAEAVQVKAVYEAVRFTLTVENGSGSGTYNAGETVNLTANYPSSGKVFAGWQVTSENASVSSADRYYASITMPSANVTVRATYKDGPSPDYNEIQNIVSGGEYLRGSTITFTAVGNGMSNTNPNPGDYRYRPVGYQIGSVSGSWSNSPYTTSMAINAVGQYTLTVNFTKDVFDGNTWTSDGTVASKSVTFNVVNALAVQTGDSSPIIPLIAVAAAALVVIVVLVIVKKRRR